MPYASFVLGRQSVIYTKSEQGQSQRLRFAVIVLKSLRFEFGMFCEVPSKMGAERSESI